MQRLVHERVRNSSFSAAAPTRSYRRVPFHLPPASPSAEGALLRPNLSRTPFVPSDPARRTQHCREIFRIQSTALARRLKHTGSQRVTLGISGGLDSTLALLVTSKAFDILGLPRDGIWAVTMPGFGTTSRTRGNAEGLAAHLGVSPCAISPSTTPCASTSRISDTTRERTT